MKEDSMVLQALQFFPSFVLVLWMKMNLCGQIKPVVNLNFVF